MYVYTYPIYPKTQLLFSAEAVQESVENMLGLCA